MPKLSSIHLKTYGYASYPELLLLLSDMTEEQRKEAFPDYFTEEEVLKIRPLRNFLVANEITTWDDFSDKVSRTILLSQKGIGRVALEKITGFLKYRGLKIRTRIISKNKKGKDLFDFDDPINGDIISTLGRARRIETIEDLLACDLFSLHSRLSYGKILDICKWLQKYGYREYSNLDMNFVKEEVRKFRERRIRTERENLRKEIKIHRQEIKKRIEKAKKKGLYYRFLQRDPVQQINISSYGKTEIVGEKDGLILVKGFEHLGRINFERVDSIYRHAGLELATYDIKPKG